METKPMELIKLTTTEEERSLVIDWIDCEYLEDSIAIWTGCTKNGGQCNKCKQSKFGATSWCNDCVFAIYKTESGKPVHLEFNW